MKWAWCRRPKPDVTPEEFLRRADRWHRRTTVTAYVGFGVFGGFWCYGLLLDLTRGKILEAVGNTIIGVCVTGSLVFMHRMSRLTRELLDRLRFSVPLPFATAAAAVNISVTSQMALFSEGTCANCGQPPEAPDNLFVKCRSGHLIHLRCLVVEEDRPPRCPLCLRRRRDEDLREPPR